MHYIKARQTGSSSEESFENLDSKSEAQIFWSQGRTKKMQFTNFVNRVTTKQQKQFDYFFNMV